MKVEVVVLGSPSLTVLMVWTQSNTELELEYNSKDRIATQLYIVLDNGEPTGVRPDRIFMSGPSVLVFQPISSIRHLWRKR